MDLALNNLQRLICHKTHQTKPNQTKPRSGVSRCQELKDYWLLSSVNYLNFSVVAVGQCQTVKCIVGS